MDPQQPSTNVASRPSQHQLQPKPLSCTNCRARKLKCSREYPCTHCQRSGAECIFPTRKRIRKPRKNKNSELLQRLSRLESIVGNVGLSALAGDNVATTASGPSTSQDTARPNSEGGSSQAQASNDEKQDDWQQALQSSKASRYLSGEFWSSLSVEVEGLKQALEQSTDSEDEEQMLQEATPESANDGSSSASALSPGMLLGSSPRTSYEAIEHPSSDHIRFLTSTFFTNVDMIIKILHRPTIEGALLAFANAPESARPHLSPETEVLFFSIYHAATASLFPSACLTHLGRRHEDLMRSFASAVEHLLGRADYLNNTSLETLQALMLYVACVRGSSGSRASWALTSLPIRLAQALNLHHEASNAHLRPYEAELRRRLWWQLVMLDIRGAEDRGTTTVLARDSYDTKLPLNIDDADFGPETRGQLTEKQGPTDMTFSLCTAQCSNLFLQIEHANGALGVSHDGGKGNSNGPNASGPTSQSVEEAVKQAQVLESRFVVGADPNRAPSYLASVTVRLIILKLWLIMQYPVHPRRKPQPLSTSPYQNTTSSSTSRPTKPTIVPHEATLRTAISIMELSEYLQNGPYGDRFYWWANTYVQWHPLAVVLAELCTQTRGELVDRAWRTVDDVFPRWSEIIADTKSGTLWRPIRKLYKKAKAARIAAVGAAAAAATPAPASATNVAVPAATASTTTTMSANTAAKSTPTTATADAAETRITTIVLKDGVIDVGKINMRTKSPENPNPNPNPIPNPTQSPPRPEREDVTMTEPESAFGAEIRNAREPSAPPDLSSLSMSPFAFNESMLGWRDLSFEIPMLDLGDGGGGANTMDWSTWNDFVNETQADADEQSKSGSSDMGYY
ncbi:fungal-specific transcription factor domain-containing protein [Annulohypoxylon truncatum]|uniref:fungal-specific transcription factor domain-containing protein n=1 Tax=Annulohypoxylon truncatum TaxID=327061 RepID=UPI0020073ED5|nr:fungal-specific transcription factor domain-containing protein [Annulohypoxylon truncatum]KAI1209278.1 fungal-specific transcription factor domain-containing protein [Annulohypoxylon truncatum]